SSGRAAARRGLRGRPLVGHARRPRRAAAPSPALGRRLRPVRRPARRPRPGAAARLPHREHRRRAAPGPRRGGAVPRRRLQDQPARPRRGAAHPVALPPRSPGRGDDALALPAPAAALPRRPPPLPALAAPRLRPRAAPGRRPVPLRARHGRPGDPGRGGRPLRRHGVATAGGAGRGAVRPARREAPVTETALTTAVDARLALSAPPLLARFNTAGVIDAPDVHVARRLGALTGESDERVLLAVALATRAVRAGSVCLRLDDAPSLAADAEAVAGEAAAGEAAAGEAAGPAGAAAPGILRTEGAPVVTGTLGTAGAPASPEPLGPRGVQPAPVGPGTAAPAAVAALPWPAPDAWRRAVEASQLVAVGVDGPDSRPVRCAGGRLYLARYCRDVLLVRRKVDTRLTRP